MKKFFFGKKQVGLPKKGLKQVVAANAVHFYIPTSPWWVSQQQSGSSYSKPNEKTPK